MKKLPLLAAVLLCLQLRAQIPYFGTLAGTGGILDTTGVNAQLYGPYALALSPNKSNLVFTENGNQTVRMVNIATRKTKLIAGAGYTLNTLTDGKGNLALFNNPNSLALANDTIAYVVDQGQQAGNYGISGIRKVNLKTGDVSTVSYQGGVCTANSGDLKFSGAAGIAVASGLQDTLYVASGNCGIFQIIPGATRSANANLLLVPNSGPFGSVSNTRQLLIYKDSLLVVQDSRILVLSRISGQGRQVAQGFTRATSAAWLKPDTLLVTDNGTGRIQKVAFAAGTKSVYIGGLSQPSGIVVTDTAVFVTENNARRISYFLKTNLVVKAFVGTNQSPVDGPGNLASFVLPNDIVWGPDKKLYCVETGNNGSPTAIRKIDPDSGKTVTIAKTGFTSLSDIAVNGTKLFVTESARNGVFRVSSYDLATGKTVRLAGASGLTGPTGTIVDGDSATSRLKFPSGIAVNWQGTKLYVGSSGGTSEGGHSIRMIDIATKNTSTLAGPTSPASGYTDGPAAAALFSDPLDVALWGDSILFIADNGNDRIRKLNLITNVVSTFAGKGTQIRTPVDNAVGLQAQIANITALHLDTATKTLYFVDGNLLRKISLLGTNPVKTIGGSTQGFADGLATSALFYNPAGLCTDSTGTNLYLTDAGNGRIRKAKFIINTAPSFTAGANVNALENSGNFSQPAWAKNILGGSKPEEANQSVTFILSNSNPVLFATQPAIASNGTLSFKTATNRFGVATISVIAKDNGGTDNGGVDSSTRASFTITIDSVNNAPVYSISAANKALSTKANGIPVSVTNWLTSVATSNAPNFELNQTLSVTIRTKKPALYSVLPVATLAGTAPNFAVSLSYTPTNTQIGVDTLSFVVKDNGGTLNNGVDSVTGTFTITITPYVNAAPSFTLPTASQTITLGTLPGGVFTLANFATAVSAGPATENAQTLNFSVSSKNPGMYNVAPSVALVTAGTVKTGTLTFTRSGKPGRDTLRIVLRDNGGSAFGGVDSVVKTAIVVINPNAAPTFTVSAANSTLRYPAGSTIAENKTNWATAIASGPAIENEQSLAFSVKTKRSSLYSVQPAIAITGTTTKTGTLTFTLAGTANAKDTLDVVLKDNGGTLGGGVDSIVSKLFIIIGTSAVQANIASQFSVYPNPGTDRVFIETANHAGKFSLIDAKGAEVANGLISGGTNELSIANLKAGLYLIKIETADGIVVQRIVKE